MNLNSQDNMQTIIPQDTDGKQTNLDRFIQLIKKDPNMRPDFACQEFIHFLKKHIEWFSTLKSEHIKEIIKRCKFLRIAPDTVFIKQGDTGDSMYAILRGTVGVHVIFETESERECLLRVETALNKKKFNKNDFGNEVAHKVEGACIGEVALVKENCMRTASCIATSECDCLVIDRALYNVSVKEFIEKEFRDKTLFVERNPLFKSWTPRQKNQLIISMRKVKVGFGEKLARQGHEVDTVYFIYTGDVEIHLDTKQYQKQFPHIYSELKSLLPELVKGNTQDPRPPHIIRRERMTRHTSQRVCILGANETIGSLEAILNLDTYIETAVAHGECELMSLKRSQFEKTFGKRFAAATLDMLKETLASKLCLYMYQSNPADVAFLKFLNMKLMDGNVLQEVRKSKYRKSKGSHIGGENATHKTAEQQEVMSVLKKLHMSSENVRELPLEDKSEIALAKMDRRLKIWSETTNLNGSKLAGLQSATISLDRTKEIA